MQKKHIAILVIIVIAVGVGAFYGGMVYKNNALSKAGLIRNANINFGGGREQGMQQGGGQQRRPGMGGLNGANGDFVNGEILAKDDPTPEQALKGAGKSITVKTRDGGSRIIFFSDVTTVDNSVKGTVADLAAGQQVVISGKSNADGTLTAQGIQIRPTSN